jgi:hypothetical protein
MLTLHSARVSTRTFFVSTLILAISLVSASAQVLTGTLSGTVTDATDAVVPNAPVTVTNLETGRDAKVVTDASGNFVVPNLDNGFYRVTVDMPGFSKAVVDRVQVFVSQVRPLNIKLEVARTGTEIVVEAQPTAVQTESVELKNSVDRAQLDNMPLPTRNPLDLVKTYAGILTPPSTAVTGGDAFVHGLRGNTTNLTQDGINVQDDFVKTSAFFAISAPVADAIGEMNVTVGGVGADAGFGSAQVSMVTRRGTNDAHGSLYWYQRTSYLNANTWFNNTNGVATPFQLQNHLGASLGGPVYLPKLYHGRNKTFFFFLYEAYREPRSQPRERTVMTTSAEQGMFTYTPTTGGGPTTVNLLNIGTIGATGQKPAINPAIMGIYTKYVPQSGYTDSGCSAGDGVNIRCIALNLAGVNNQDRWNVRLDHQLTSKHSIEFVWSRASFTTTPDFLNSNEPSFPGAPWAGDQDSSRELFVWALQSVLSPTKTNEVRIGYQHAPVNFAYSNNFSETGGTQINYLTVTAPIQTTTNLPQGRNTPVRQYIDNFAWVKGNHQIRFGGEFRQQVADSYFWNTVYPRLTLGTNSANQNNLSTSTLAGISASELTLAQNIFANITGLMGSINQGFNHTSPTSGYVSGVPEDYTPIQNNFAFYIQDSWKMRRNLTIQAGVRWEYEGPYDARNGLVLLPQNAIQSAMGPTPITGGPVANLFQPGNLNGATDTILTLQGATNGHETYNKDLNNFAPFFGFAYSPGTNGKTSIRGSFSTNYVQDGFTFFTGATTSNTGLFTTASNSIPTGAFSTSGIASQLPQPKGGGFPVSEVANWINFQGSSSILTYDPNLRTPYVLEWSLGAQRELWKHYAIEARYVGNHGVKQYRTWNINELNLTSNGLLNEFIHAQNNYNIDQANKVNGTFAYSGLPGQAPTPILDKIFAGLPATSGYQSSSFITNLTQNQVYTMYNTIRTSPTYLANIYGANALGNSNFPLNFFVANPWATNVNLVNNASWSRFDALEVELNRRFSNGFFVLGNYTFGKAFSDTAFGSSQTENQNYLSLRNTALDKFRPAFDVRHSFGLTVSYPLPFGRGQKFLANIPRAANVIAGGWVINGFTHWSSGAPFSISSNRATLGSALFPAANLQNMTAAQLQKYIGVFRTGNGVYWLDPASGLIKVNGKTSTPVLCTAGQTTPCFSVPDPGTIGNLQYNDLSGPRFFDQDLSLTKDTKIWERLNFQIRLEAFDAFNNANFASTWQGAVTTSTTGNTNGLDSQQFGQLNQTFDTARGGGVTARVVQWAIRLTF